MQQTSWRTFSWHIIYITESASILRCCRRWRPGLRAQLYDAGPNAISKYGCRHSRVVSHNCFCNMHWMQNLQQILCLPICLSIMLLIKTFFAILKPKCHWNQGKLCAQVEVPVSSDSMCEVPAKPSCIQYIFCSLKQFYFLVYFIFSSTLLYKSTPLL